jgi:hypothetical protein
MYYLHLLISVCCFLHLDPTSKHIDIVTGHKDPIASMRLKLNQGVSLPQNVTFSAFAAANC